MKVNNIIYTLLDYHDKGVKNVSVKLIAKSTGYTHKTIIKYLRYLTDIGVVDTWYHTHVNYYFIREGYDISALLKFFSTYRKLRIYAK